MPDHIQVRKDLPSGTVILDRPDHCNAITPQTIRELSQAFHDFHGEQKVTGVVLTGVGASFCSGTDLKYLHRQLQEPTPELLWDQEISDWVSLIETLLRFPKPVVAAVNGSVRGNGMALMLACDYVIAGKSASFGLPEVKSGLVPGISTPLLARRCTAGFANRLIMTGNPVDADHALNVQLIDEIVENDLVWARSQQIATELEESCPASLQLARQLVNQTINESLFTQLNVGAANTAAARSTEFAAKGIEAFVEKRKSVWR